MLLHCCKGPARPRQKAIAKTAGGSAAGETQKLVIAASPSPHAKILNDFAKEKLAKKGIELVVKEYTDDPNIYILYDAKQKKFAILHTAYMEANHQGGSVWLLQEDGKTFEYVPESKAISANLLP